MSQQKTAMAYTFIIFASITLTSNAMQVLKTVYRGFDKMAARILRPKDIPVFMEEAKTISLDPIAQEPMTISTTGLICCSATVVYASDKEGGKHAILTHYPNNHSNHVPAFKEQIRALIKTHGGKNINRVRFLTIMPKESWSYPHEDPTKTRIALEAVVQENFPCDDKIIEKIEYDLPSLTRFDKTEVYVTISPNKNSSRCRIYNWNKDHNIEFE